MKRTSPRRAPRAQANPLPLLVQMLALYIQPDRTVVRTDLTTALAAARRILRIDNAGDRDNAVLTHIDELAKKTYPTSYVVAERADILGDMQAGFSQPALYLGIALTYLLLTNNGGAR